MFQYSKFLITKQFYWQRDPINPSIYCRMWYGNKYHHNPWRVAGSYISFNGCTCHTCLIHRSPLCPVCTLQCHHKRDSATLAKRPTKYLEISRHKNGSHKLLLFQAWTIIYIRLNSICLITEEWIVNTHTPKHTRLSAKFSAVHFFIYIQQLNW